MVLFKGTFHYFSVYRRYVGSRIYLIFLLTLLAAVTEGLGIALLLPLLMLMDSSADTGSSALVSRTNDPELASVLERLLEMFGIDDSQLGILIFISLVFVLKGAIKFLEGAYKSHLQAQLMRELRGRLFDEYSTMEYGYYCSRNTGHFINAINVQIQALVTSFDRYSRFLASMITVGVYFLFAFLVNWPFALMALFAGALTMVILRRLSSYVRRLSRKTAAENGTLNHFLVQSMQAFKYLASTAQIGHIAPRILDSIYRLTNYMRKQGVAQAFTEAVREPLAVAVLVGIIAVQFTVLEAPLAPILVALILVYRVMIQLVGVQVNWQATMRNIGSLELIEQEFESVGRAQQSNGPVQVKSLCEGLKLDGVSFSYDGNGGEKVLRNISLTIAQNNTVAFVGESGAGKSTLVDLLTLMLLPTEGQLEINGIPHGKIDRAYWRSQIGYVSQETVIFDDTIANNISLWRGNYDENPEVRAHVESAAQRAYAASFIESLPQGYNSRVGERGMRLSGGQRQRLFIARELFKSPRLLILDEATSALDSESERAIKRTLTMLKGRMTIVIIAHRLSTIVDADQIYVLDKGKVVESGSYQQLLAREQGAFSRMVALQSL